MLTFAQQPRSSLKVARVLRHTDLVIYLVRSEIIPYPQSLLHPKQRRALDRHSPLRQILHLSDAVPRTTPSYPSKMAAAVDMSRRNKKPRLLSDAERERLDEFAESIHYSPR